MHTILFYLGALALYGLGASCIRNTQRYSRLGGDRYLWKEKRRVIGVILIVMATISLGTGILSQFYR